MENKVHDFGRPRKPSAESLKKDLENENTTKCCEASHRFVCAVDRYNENRSNKRLTSIFHQLK
jgi:hypothetical protein